ncbi:MAG TPA: ATP-dependent Clp protease proteolytic subunit [Acidimicrobiia bacterium]|nr:ATP-dependent Clp protease proteolytic subunit [Acidimicrobiia bacterium]
MAPEPTAPTTPAPFIPGFASPLGSAAHLTERLLDARIVVVSGQIDDALATSVCSQLLVLEGLDRRRDISLYINSPGGSVDAGFAIYDTMQSLACDVVTVAMGLAASMGQFLLVAGTPGKRFALRHSQILMHQPLGQMSGVASDILVHADHIAYLRRLMAERIAFHTGQSEERIVADFDRDRWFTAVEAQEYGMIDAVLDSQAQLRALPARQKTGI